MSICAPIVPTHPLHTRVNASSLRISHLPVAAFPSTCSPSRGPDTHRAWTPPSNLTHSPMTGRTAPPSSLWNMVHRAVLAPPFRRGVHPCYTAAGWLHAARAPDSASRVARLRVSRYIGGAPRLCICVQVMLSRAQSRRCGDGFRGVPAEVLQL